MTKRRSAIIRKTLSEAEFRAWEDRIHAFVFLAGDAFTPSETDAKGPLAGMRVGVKDIVDVAGIPTRNGSAAYADARPASTDADVVARLRGAGARIVGKTTTTEFAFTDPTNCRNPYDLRRTPGGSSSGSGAAVSAGLVDIAVGTQTAGSLCRPAAYCGVAGFKPTYGLFSTGGVTPLAPSFDSVGIMAGSVELLRRVLTVLSDSPPEKRTGEMRAARLLFPTEVTATADLSAAYESATEAMVGSASRVETLETAMDTDAIVAAHRTVMIAEAAQVHASLLSAGFVEKLQPKFRQALQDGAQVPKGAVGKARALLAASASEFWRKLEGIDVVLTLPTPDAAPLLDGTTGFQDWLTPWTVFGGPLVCLPWGLDALGRPLSIMLAGRPGRDAELLDVAAQLEIRAPDLPGPVLR